MAPPRVSKIDVVEKAARLVRDGALGAAVREYQQLFENDPNDWAVANTLGDLYLRMGRTDEGISHFMTLAEHVAGDGYTAKARALYRKILRVQPDNQAAAERVVQLESQHLDSNPFMQRMLDTVRQSQAAAVAQAAAAQEASPTEPAAAQERPAEPAKEAAVATPPPPPAAVPTPAPVSVADIEPAAHTTAPEPAAPAAVHSAAVEPPLPEPAAPVLEVETEPEIQLDVPEVATEPAVPFGVLEVVPEPDVQVDLLEVVTEPDLQVVLPKVATEPAVRADEPEDNVVELSADWDAIDLGGADVKSTDIGAALGLRRLQPAAKASVRLLPDDEPVDTHADCAAFTVPADDWVPTCLQLAALPLPEDPPPPVNPHASAGFAARQASALRAAAAGDFEGAATPIEAFLRDYPNHLPALELLLDLSVDGRPGDVPSVQMRLAHACLATRQASRARQVALDLQHRYHGDPGVMELVGLVARLAPTAAVPVQAYQQDRDDVEPVELFDDDGLVTVSVDDVPERPAVATPASPLDAWLDATEASAANEALATAEHLRAAGNIAGASAVLKALMDTPGMRPYVGVRLAQFYREQGKCIEALRCLELTAEQPPLDDDSGHALAYELALTLEAMGNRQDALGVYRELLSEVGPAFRDVAARADCLSAA